MEFALILTAIVISTLLNIVFLRYYAKSLSSKILFGSEFSTSAGTTPIEVSSSGWTGNNPLFSKKQKEFVDAPSQNSVMENDPNELEFNEQAFSSLPKDLKVEIEGGDTTVPLHFEPNGSKK